MLNIVRKHLLNFPGKRLKKKYILFESDDWGSERIPSVVGIKSLKDCGVDIYKNPFNYLDSLESENDLTALFEVLMQFKDRNGNHPVITANSIVANPDFDKIRASGFNEYYFESVLETYKNKKGCENSFSIIKDGMSAGVFQPQFHGREHLNVNQWMAALKSGDEVIHNAFNAGIYGIDFDNGFSKRNNFMAALDGHNVSYFNDHETILLDGTTIFEKLYGFASKSFIAPCYVWHPAHEQILLNQGVKYFQGLPVQLVPNEGSRFKRVYHYQGQKNDLNQRYFVRNCFFEPSLGSSQNLVEECIERLKIIFFWGKPAIIGTHRINFAGSLNEDNRKNNLEMLSALLYAILRIWPDAEFISTDQLGELY